MKSFLCLNTGAKETSLLEVLDIVKHAVKTVIHTLGAGDRLAIVAFESSARLACNLLEMNAEGKLSAEAALASLSSGGGTNIWAGLELGMDVLRSSERAGRFGQLLLLTDGEPSVSPPEGHREVHFCNRCRLNTQNYRNYYRFAVL